MERMEIENIVKSILKQVALEQDIALPEPIEDHHLIVDELGFHSLEVATITSLLESAFGVCPFTENITLLTKVRSVEDICDVYEDRLAKRERERE